MADSLALSDLNLRKPCPKPLMLKDFLLDDMSSCSSNGFRSLPRRHCCTTVRYPSDKDLGAKAGATNAKRLLKKSRSKAATSITISALQRASEAVINAVKLLPLSTVKAPSSSVRNRFRKGILARSFSRKLLKRKFWKRAAVKEEIEVEIERWKSFRDFLEEKQKSASQSRRHSAAITIDTTTATSNSSRWSDVEFSSDYLQFSSCDSENSGENDAVPGKEYSPAKASKRVGVQVGLGEGSMGATAATCSVQNAKEWPNEEKEQLSPVSVLDCPFEDEEEDEDEDEGMCSPFKHKASQMEGGTKQKVRRFENVGEVVEPVDLETRIELSESGNEPVVGLVQESLRLQPESMSIHPTREETATGRRQAQNILKRIKAKTAWNSCSNFNADTILLDFFEERIAENYPKADDEINEELVKVAEEWMKGGQGELLKGWEVESGRTAYTKQMEEKGKWGKLEEEKEELAAQVESEVLTCLLDEVLLELSTTT